MLRNAQLSAALRGWGSKRAHKEALDYPGCHSVAHHSYYVQKGESMCRSHSTDGQIMQPRRQVYEEHTLQEACSDGIHSPGGKRSENSKILSIQSSSYMLSL